MSVENARDHGPFGGRSVRWLLFAVATVVGLALAIMVALAIDLIRAQPHAFHGLPYDPPRPAPEFAFIDQNGQPVRLTDLRGKLVLVYFGFLHCPDACPATLSTWTRVHKELGSNAEHVCFVFITVDPERDTPEDIKRHLALFNSEFIGLSGSLDDTEDVARAYHVFMQKVDVGSAAGYLVNHTTLTFVIDQMGQLVLAYPVGVTSPEIVADLKHLLQ